MSLYTELNEKIGQVYTEACTMAEAEQLSAGFLTAMLNLSGELKKADMDARMRKSGVKALRASAYLEIIKNNEKKPVEALISALIDTDTTVLAEQTALDEAEANEAELERMFSVYREAHLYFRSISKGQYNG